MFGVIISSRPVITDLQQITPTQIAFTIPAAPTFSHLVVFLLPGQQLPPDSGAAVYLQLPNQSEFKFLGAIANDKPSAIFKVNPKAIGIDGVAMGNGGADDAMTDDATAPFIPTEGNVTLGISLEPVAQIQRSIVNLKSGNMGNPSTSTDLVLARPTANIPVSTKVLAQRIIANAYNFLASFSGNVGPGGMEVVPLKSFQDWWKKFERKVDMDPSFLERGDQA
ncbi:DUF775 domain protein [Pseudovirgaria hyperparasitica]|uniref:DUF775 domain protein n=1 Tax=Pseudovirgaria hyperparasitica TaxID=470096 RepID=A0A6A6W0C4_9PEZI|nr:DUF775 domain protein [Pseudovirgaria hyperparasitica]KAF2755380.1 DUF775 domain protein [Pseudovirgaria hyperparasitica]